jgi:phenylpropionate dioxygenase-like ring-hydroxylating dioxygenase large terminal subunit
MGDGHDRLLGGEVSARARVDMGIGEISRDIFVSEEIYRREQAQVFARAWLYVGHESQIRKPGDFFLSRMGEESVILTRDQNHKIRVLLNTCRHRGMKVCRYDEGNTKTFYCPYHAWTYGLDGSLIGVQDYRGLYQPPFDKEDWGLVQVAKIATFRGTVWATWDSDAPDFETYLGGARRALDAGLAPWDGGDGEVELLDGVQKWIVPSNWKVVAENGSGDMLHNVSHRSVDLAGIGPKEGSGRRDPFRQLALSALPEGHGFIYDKVPSDADRNDYSLSPITAEYFKEAWRRRVELLGEAAGVGPVVGAIFPNMCFHAQQPRTIMVAHPRSATSSELWRVYFVDKDAPTEVKQFLRRYYLSYSGPGGMTEQDDMENWGYATQGCHGEISQRHPFHYKAGMGLEGTDPMVPGAVTENPIGSEQNPRALYNRWAQFMDAATWNDIPTGRAAA